MKRKKHNVETLCIVVVTAVFLGAMIVVLLLGIRFYSSLVKRDNLRYDRRIITSYVVAKVREHDESSSVAVGGFGDEKKPDGIETLHLYRTLNGERVKTRIYCYKGQIYELYTLAELALEPEDGTPIAKAKELHFEMEGTLLQILVVGENGANNCVTVALRSEREG